MSEQMLQNFIDGKYVEAIEANRHNIVDPCTGFAYLTAPVSGASQVEMAMRAAAIAFERWRDSTPAERQLALLRIADALDARAEEFIAVEVRNTGSKALVDDLPLIIDQLRFFAGAARVLDGKSAGEYQQDHTSYVRREAIGVCAQLAPWNYPLMMAVLKAAPAIAAGNTVVLKPAETTPITTLMFAELAAEHLPPGVLNVICGGDETGRLLVEHHVPDMVSLTGSVATGIDVARAASAQLKRLHLELGGKTPVIVCADADLEKATADIIAGGFANAGQDCTAATRILADAAIYDDLLHSLTEAARKCQTGPPSDPQAFYGPLNNSRQLQRVDGFIDRLPAHARVLTGGRRAGNSGYFFEPTIIADVRQSDEITQREIFGPVISIQRFDSEDDAVQLANDVDYGLAAGVWTSDHSRAMRMSRRLDYGTVRINTHLSYPSEMPHGGFKKSGYGKDLSTYSLDEYTRLKHVVHHIGAIDS